MARIPYTQYSFQSPQTPLSEVDYEKLKRMGAADFKEYLSAVSSASWRRFREYHSPQIKIFVWGIFGGLLVAGVFRKVDAIVFVAIIALWFGLISGCSLLMSASAHSNYIGELKRFFKKRREMIVLSNSYDEYVSQEARSKS